MNYLSNVFVGLEVIKLCVSGGSLPFDGTTLRELRERVLRGKYRIPFYMSTDCENLLKKFLVLNPTKRASLETIMKDKWMNMGYEDDELKPYIEPEAEYNDLRRIETLTGMGYNKSDIEDSLRTQKYDDIFATYLLLGRRSSDVSQCLLYLITYSFEFNYISPQSAKKINLISFNAVSVGERRFEIWIFTVTKKHSWRWKFGRRECCQRCSIAISSRCSQIDVCNQL